MGLREGMTVFNLRVVIITLHGAFKRLKDMANFSVALPLYILNKEHKLILIIHGKQTSIQVNI